MAGIQLQGSLLHGWSFPTHPAWVSLLFPEQEAILSALDGGVRVTRGKGQGCDARGEDQGQEYVPEQMN